jgi:VCBS repeat-containing protein
VAKTYFVLNDGNLTQNWTNTGLITTSTPSTAQPTLTGWESVPSIVGYRGDDLTTATGVSPADIKGTSNVFNVIANQANPNTLTSGGIAEFEIGNPTVALQGSGTADAPYLAIYLDATGRENVTLSFNARDLDGSADDAVQALAVQYRVGDTGEWINVPGGLVADATTANLATKVTPLSVTLPAGANNQPQLQVRIITTNAGGNDEWVGVDDIVVSSSTLASVAPGLLSISDASVVEGDSGSSDLVFTVTRSGGSDGAVSASWSVSLTGNAAANDLGTPLSGTVSFAAGETSATIRVPVLGDLVAEPNETFSVLLSAPTGGATIAYGTGIGTIRNDDVPPVANVFINEINYDPAGTDAGEFIEVAGLAGTNLSGWTLVLYNGNGGAAYTTLNLGGVLADSANGFGFRSVTTASNGIQNGAPDGIALVDPFGRVIQFLSYEGTMTAAGGPAAGLTSTDIGVYQDQAPLGTSLQLTGTGSSYGDFIWAFDVASTSGGTNAGQTFLSGTDRGQIRIGDAAVVEGNGGTTALTFTVTRAGGFATEASVAYSLDFGTSASANDLAPNTATTGVVTFAPGEFTKTITVHVNGDTQGEGNEGFLVRLGDVTGNASIVDDSALGVILNDDPVTRSIMAIQGEGHTSPFVGQPVITSGIVTAVDTNGFYLQDPNDDGNRNTSDGIFIKTAAVPTVKVGDALQLTGIVGEYKPSEAGLSVTQITASTITVVSSNNPLPAAVLIGAGALLPPTESIDSDGLTFFNPAQDGIDFWEALEGMRVTIDSPIAVASSNEFGETDIVASGGTGATGINDRGGITISDGDYNPEKIELDDRLVAQPTLSTGDLLAPVTGIINYSFERYEVLATERAVITTDRTLEDDNTVLRGDANYVSVATYNLENLDPSDMKYDILAQDILYSLKAPDIIAVQEVQDADGAGSGSNLSGASNVQGLIDAISKISGIVYTYVEIAPTTAGSTGGEPGGNIRNGYLYQADRVALVEGSLGLINDTAFSGSRKPLVATWSFNEQEFTTVNVHFTSRLGSDPLWGDAQPPQNGGDSSRTAQAAAVGDYVFDIIAGDASKQFVLLGDWNGFYFEGAPTQLTKDGVFTNLATLLPEAERYSYLFEGNSQLIDNVLVTGGLLPSARYDAVHINAEFTGTRPTDHDPQLALLRVAITPHDVVLAGATVAENLPAGTLVGTLSATDTPGDKLTYALLDDAGGRFTVDAATGEVRTTQAFDFEATTTFTLKVKVTDSAGLTSSNNVSVNVANVNEAPTAVADVVAVNEDATSDNLWSLLLGNDRDPDAGDALSISAVSGTGTLGSLIFDPTTQSLRYVADNDAFDALAPGASTVDRFTYTVADRNGLTSTASVEVTVTGVADGVTTSGGNGDDTVNGTAGEDRLFGNNGVDRLFGLDGHDRLEGGNGNDQLFGGRGNDLLIGGQGDDLLEGGLGRDAFVLAAKGGNDTIRDFDLTNDRLLFDNTAIRSSQVGDWNNDGTTDIRVNLTTGGSVTLLGLSSLTGVQTGTATEAQMSFRYGAEDIGVSGQHLLGGDQWLVA